MTSSHPIAWVEKDPAGHFRLRNMPSLMAGAIEQLPDLLDPAAPGIRDRIAGTPYPGDEEGSRHWEKYGAPELAHLFQSAREVVAEDVRGLMADGHGAKITIPPGHMDAWLSALSAARLGLADAHRLGAAQLEAPLPGEIRTKRQKALYLIHILGWVQGMLLEAGA